MTLKLIVVVQDAAKHFFMPANKKLPQPDFINYCTDSVRGAWRGLMGQIGKRILGFFLRFKESA